MNLFLSQITLPLPYSIALSGNMLVGPPGSGKSVFAAYNFKDFDKYKYISTDDIREEAFGDVNHTGDFRKIQRIAADAAITALENETKVIYDATNFNADQRTHFLDMVSSHIPTNWVIWVLRTPLKKCQEWNSARDRVVPFEVIEYMYHYLSENPVEISEHPNLSVIVNIFPGGHFTIHTS